jgi:hypothetical protein
LKGNRFSTVAEDGDTTQVAVLSPYICALRGLIVFPVDFKVLQASTMLRVGSPVEILSGIVLIVTSPSVALRPS